MATAEGGASLLLIDVFALVYRAFFALPALTGSGGRPINAAYGFERMLNRMLNEVKPSHVVACFDAGIPAERLAIYPVYKAQRPKMPEDLASQWDLVRAILAGMRVAMTEIEGEEADDVIATLAARASRDTMRSTVVTGDLDLLQIVDEHCTVVVTKRGISELARYDVPAVIARFGLRPDQLPDYRGLKGDPSDNLAGVPGIGEKTAAKLIREYGTLDQLLERAADVKPARVSLLLQTHADQARRCRDVSIAKRDLAVELTWEEAAYAPPSRDQMVALYRSLGFHTLAARAEAGGPATVAVDDGPAEEPQRKDQIAPVAQQSKGELITDPSAAAAALERARKSRRVALALVPDIPSWRERSPDGLAFAAGDEPTAWAIPIALLGESSVRAAFAGLVQADDVDLTVFDAKNLAGWLATVGIDAPTRAFDVLIAAQLLERARPGATLGEVAAAWNVPIPQIAPEKQQTGLFDGAVGVDASSAAAASATRMLGEILAADLDAAGLTPLAREIEFPLAPVLARIEAVGFRLDLDELARIRAELDAEIDAARSAVYALAGSEFNINSPKALGSVLFEQLGLSGGARTKTGWATGAEVLTPLAAEHEIARRVLEFREFTKLKSTYVDALPALVDARDGRLHTTLHQLGAATGRLSSVNPNLQNIPVRSAAGRAIRRAFLAPTPGNVLLAADYSQIELRLFAHMSGDEQLLAAFRRGDDIHAFTARAVFGVPDGTPLDPELRRRAKAVNFGILYGQGDFGLSQSAGMTRAQAKEFIAAYFARFPQVRAYIDASLEKARADGFVTTLFGRRRHLPDLRARNYGLRAQAERIATNAPLQGSAADLIKTAMIRIDARLRERKLDARPLLQVHDELIFDVPPALLAEVREEVRAAMEGAMELRVPLVVDFKSGPTWAQVEPDA